MYKRQISNILGNLLGSHFALKKGARFIRPMMLVVLVLLLGKDVYKRQHQRPARGE